MQVTVASGKAEAERPTDSILESLRPRRALSVFKPESFFISGEEIVDALKHAREEAQEQPDNFMSGEEVLNVLK